MMFREERKEISMTKFPLRNGEGMNEREKLVRS